MLYSSGHVAHTDRARWPALVGGTRADVRDQRCPWPVIRARPGGSCKASHDAEFGVGDSYHVVRSEQDIFTARGHLAGNGMLRFPAKPCRGLGPIRTLDSGDDTAFWGAPPSASACKGPSGAFAHSLPSFRSSYSSTPYVIAGLRPHYADSTHSPAPAHHSVHSLWTPPSQLKPLLHAHGIDVRCLRQETTRRLSGGYRTTEHSPRTYWWRVRAINSTITKVPRDRRLNSSPVLLQLLFIGFSVSVSWDLSIQVSLQKIIIIIIAIIIIIIFGLGLLCVRFVS